MQFTEKDIQLAETQNCEKRRNLKVVSKRKKKIGQQFPFIRWTRIKNDNF